MEVSKENKTKKAFIFNEKKKKDFQRDFKVQ